MKRTFVAFFVLLSACATETGGETTGLITSADGKYLGRATFSQRGSCSGTITAALPNGEVFDGTFLAITTCRTDDLASVLAGLAEVTDRAAEGFAKDPLIRAQKRQERLMKEALKPDDASANWVNYEAILSSNRGASMRCEFRSDRVHGNGIGQCHISDGRSVAVHW